MVEMSRTTSTEKSFPMAQRKSSRRKRRSDISYLCFTIGVQRLNIDTVFKDGSQPDQCRNSP